MTTLKTCFKCETEKPRGEFYPHKMMADRSVDRCPTCGRKRKRSSAQNRMYWALLTMMAAREWSGERYSVKAFHIYYREKFLGCEDVKLPNGKVETMPLSTAEADTPEFSDYFDKVQADAAERGVYLADLDGG
jgi:hypothetical protein